MQWPPEGQTAVFNTNASAVLAMALTLCTHLPMIDHLFPSLWSHGSHIASLTAVLFRRLQVVISGTQLKASRRPSGNLFMPQV